MIGMIHRILRFSGEYAWKIRFAYVVSFLKSICNTFPLMMAVWVLDGFIHDTVNITKCLMVGGAIFVMFLIYAFLQTISDQLQSGTGYKILADQRKKFGAHLKKLPMGYFTEGNIGRISSILSQDMVYIEEQSMTVIADATMDMFSQCLMIVFLFWIHPYLGIVIGTVTLIIILVAQLMIRRSRKGAKGRNIAIEDLTGSVLEYTEGLPIIKSFSLTGESSKDIRGAFARMKKSSLDFEMLLVPYELTMAVLYGLGRVALLVTTLYLMEHGELSTTYFVASLFMIFTSFTAIKHLYQQTTRMTLMSDSLDRIQSVFAVKEIEDVEETQKDSLSTDDCATADSDFEIEFDHVSFAYDQEDVLKDISFTVKKQTMTALVGSSGGGKSTVANLLARFWDVNEGAVKIRGKDIRTMSLENLMNQISMVFQRVYLFNDTIYNNIAMARPTATKEEVYEAAKKASCYDFIMKLPFGFDTVIGEGGSSLSGGEAQRISIARCILKDAPIIILDEATASIDADNERCIREAMDELCKGKTTIVIAHRLYTVKDAEQILVIDQGKICERGTREELLRMNGMYARLEEAANE